MGLMLDFFLPLPLPLPAFSPSGPRAKFRLAMERAMERAIARGEGHRPGADQHLRATPRMFHRKSRRFNSINNGASPTMGHATSAQGTSPTMGQVQRKCRAILIVEDDAEVASANSRPWSVTCPSRGSRSTC
jgi:hypothetical protein